MSSFTPDLDTEAASLFAYWSLESDGGVSEYDVSDGIGHGGISEYQIFDNGFIALVEDGEATITLRAKSDGWLTAHLTDPSYMAFPGFYEYETPADDGHTALSRVLDDVAGLIAGVTVAPGEVGYYHFGHPDAEFVTHMADTGEFVLTGDAYPFEARVGGAVDGDGDVTFDGGSVLETVDSITQPIDQTREVDSDNTIGIVLEAHETLSSVELTLSDLATNATGYEVREWGSGTVVAEDSSVNVAAGEVLRIDTELTAGQEYGITTTCPAGETYAYGTDPDYFPSEAEAAAITSGVYTASEEWHRAESNPYAWDEVRVTWKEDQNVKDVTDDLSTGTTHTVSASETGDRASFAHLAWSSTPPGFIKIVGVDSGDGTQDSVYTSPTGGDWEVTQFPIPVNNNAVAAYDGALYSLGGWSFDAGGRVGTLYRYNGDGWADTGTPSPTTLQSTSMAVYDGELYAIGGSGEEATRDWVFRYDGEGWTEDGTIPAPRHDHRVVAYDGALYVLGGRNDQNNEQNTVFRYAGAGWSTVASLPKALRMFGAAVYNGYLYVVGGYDADRNESAAVYRYDGNGWAEADPLPNPRRNHAVVTANGYLYAICGKVDGLTTDTVLRYDGTGWEQVGTTPTAINSVSAGVYEP